MELVCGAKYFLVEIAVKLGVLLGVLYQRMRREKARESLQVVQPLTCVFDVNKLIENENGRLKIFEVICTLLHPPFIQLDIHL